MLSYFLPSCASRPANLTRFAALLLVPLALSSCSCGRGKTGRAATPFAGSDVLVTGPDRQASGASVEIDVYLDATTSMEGYVGAQAEYGEFLRSLEASLISKWGESDVRFYKFGSRVDSVDRASYLSARDDLRFYRERGVFERTNIDSVLARTSADRLSLIITDLFQDAGDTNALVGKIKSRVFARGLAVGVLAVESAFDGRVYDAPGGPYRYASTPGDPSTYRPFYALAIGASSQVERLFETLRGAAGVRPDRMALISPYIVKDFALELRKLPGDASKGINIASAEGGMYRFIIRDGYDGGLLEGALQLTPAPLAAQVVPDRVELTAFRREAGAADSVRTDEFKLSEVQANGDDLTFRLAVEVEAPPGDYDYLLLFQAGGVDGLTPPAWVSDLSTTNPTSDTDPNKTLNLDRLMTSLVQASATVQRPLIGRVALSLTKK